MVKREKTESFSYNIEEIWTACSREELEVEFEKECAKYHPMGYGTSLIITEDFNSLVFKGSFYRRKSCD